MKRYVFALALSATAPVWADTTETAPTEAQTARAQAADDVVAKAFAKPGNTGSATVTPGAAPESSTPITKLIGWTLGLAAVGTLVMLQLKKKQRVKDVSGSVSVSQSLTVGQKQKLLVVNFGEQQLLVGASDAGFSLIASQKLDLTPIEVPTAVPAAPVAKEFNDLLDDELKEWMAARPAEGGSR